MFRQIAAFTFTYTNTWELPAVTTAFYQLLNSSTGAARSQEYSLKSTLTVAVKAEESATHWFHPTAFSTTSHKCACPTSRPPALIKVTVRHVKYYLQWLFMVWLNFALMISGVCQTGTRKKSFYRCDVLNSKHQRFQFGKYRKQAFPEVCSMFYNAGPPCWTDIIENSFTASLHQSEPYSIHPNLATLSQDCLKSVKRHRCYNVTPTICC